MKYAFGLMLLMAPASLFGMEQKTIAELQRPLEEDELFIRSQANHVANKDNLFKSPLRLICYNGKIDKIRLYAVAGILERNLLARYSDYGTIIDVDGKIDIKDRNTLEKFFELQAIDVSMYPPIKEEDDKPAQASEDESNQ